MPGGGKDGGSRLQVRTALDAVTQRGLEQIFYLERKDHRSL